MIRPTVLELQKANSTSMGERVFGHAASTFIQVVWVADAPVCPSHSFGLTVIIKTSFPYTYI